MEEEIEEIIEEEGEGDFREKIKKIREELASPERLKVNRVGTKRIESKVKDGELKIDFITIGGVAEGQGGFYQRPER